MIDVHRSADKLVLEYQSRTRTHTKISKKKKEFRKVFNYLHEMLVACYIDITCENSVNFFCVIIYTRNKKRIYTSIGAYNDKSSLSHIFCF